MGGRSDTRFRRRFDNTQNFEFVAELSNSRLNRYGRYSAIGYQNIDTPTRTQDGIPVNHEAFNAALSAEYFNRFGSAPSWDISTIDEAEKRRRKNLGFKDGD